MKAQYLITCVMALCMVSSLKLHAYHITIKNETTATMYVNVNLGTELFCPQKNFHVDGGQSKKVDVGGCCTKEIECRLDKKQEDPTCSCKPKAPAFGLKCGSVSMTITKDSSGSYQIKEN